MRLTQATSTHALQRRSPRRAKASAGRIPRETFEIANSIVASLSYQREDRGLGIRASDDPSVARHFNRTRKDRAAARLHPLPCDDDLADVEVIEPERDGL